MTISVQIMVLPITVIEFGQLNLSFLFTFVLATILVAPVILLGFFNIFIPDPLSNFINLFLSILLFILNKSAEITARIPFLNTYVITPSYILICTYYIFLFVSNYLYSISHIEKTKLSSFQKKVLKQKNSFKRKICKIDKKKIIIITLLFCISLQFGKIIPKDLRIFFVDVGQGDCTLILTPGNKSILIDGGGTRNSEEYDIGEQVLLPYLLNRKVKEIDYMFISHFDADHCNGLIAILENLKVDTLLIGEQAQESEEYYKIMEVTKNNNVDVKKVKEGDKILIEKDCIFHILYPERNLPFNDLNNNSIVIKLIYRNFSMLFTGDIGEKAEKKILEKNIDVRANILKVSHHGAATSSTEEFIKKVNPIVAIIGVGEKNTFGHPNEKVLERFRKNGISVYRTDLHGEIEIRIKTNGKVEIKTKIRMEK